MYLVPFNNIYNEYSKDADKLIMSKMTKIK